MPRPRLDLLDRLVTKIKIGDRLATHYNLHEFKRIPTEEWPAELNLPWLWIASACRRRPSPRLVMLKDGPKTYFCSNPLTPNFRVNNRSVSVPRLLYTIMIRELNADEKLYHKLGRGHSLDVNPLHYEPKKILKIGESPELYAPDEADTQTLTQFAAILPPDELRYLVEQAEEEWAKRPFTTWAEFHERFAELWFDVTPENQLLVLKEARLLERIS